MEFLKQMPGCSKAVSVDDSVVSPTAVPATTSTPVLTDASKSSNRFSRVFISNTGANACYIALGNTCDLSNFDFSLPSGALPFELTPYLGPVSAFCNAAGGTTIAAVRLMDKEVAPGQGNIVTPAQPVQ